MTKRVLLCIMDGFGEAPNSNENAVYLANTPNIDSYKKLYPSSILHADGEYVGLPEGQMGNSEVGHLNLGAGRIVYQELSRINNSIKSGDFFKNERFLSAIEHVKKNNSSLHFYGLVSSGGVHSSLEHLKALIKLASDSGLKNVYVHAFLDGRDTPPQSAVEFVEEIENELKKYDVIIGDPLFKPICADKKFIELPHEAFSGRCFTKNAPNLIYTSLKDF